MVHIWHEDSKRSSTTQFWCFLQNEFVAKILYDAEIRGFGSNEALVTELQYCKFKSSDIYYILLDNVLDNPDIVVLHKKVKRIEHKNKNVVVSNLLCFEFLILSFIYLDAWVKPYNVNKGYTSAMCVRDAFINCINNNGMWVRNKVIVDYVIDKWNLTHLDDFGIKRELSFITSEDIAFHLLCDIVNSGSLDFTTTKTRLGTCWTCNCCDKDNEVNKTNKNNRKHCNLYRYKKDRRTKALNLLNCTAAKQILTEIEAAMR